MLAENQLKTIRDRVLLLRTMPNLDAVDEHALTSLAEHSKLRRFQTDDVLLREGGLVESAYMIVSGSVRVDRDGHFFRDFQRSMPVGMLSVMARDTLGVHAIALEPTVALEIPAEAILANMQSNFAIVSNAVRLLTREILEKRGGLPAAPDSTQSLDVGTWRKDALTLVERLLLLRQTPFGAKANLDALAELARCTREVRFAPGDLIWRHGDPSDHWVRIDFGRVSCKLPDGRGVEVAAGFSLGVFDSLAGVSRAYDARAETPIIALRTDLLDQMAVMENHVPLASEMTAMLARTVLGQS